MLSARPRRASGEVSRRQRRRPQADGGEGGECVLDEGNTMYETGQVSGNSPVCLDHRVMVS